MVCVAFKGELELRFLDAAVAANGGPNTLKTAISVGISEGAVEVHALVFTEDGQGQVDVVVGHSFQRTAVTYH